MIPMQWTEHMKNKNERSKIREAGSKSRAKAEAWSLKRVAYRTRTHVPCVHSSSSNTRDTISSEIGGDMYYNGCVLGDATVCRMAWKLLEWKGIKRTLPKI